MLAGVPVLSSDIPGVRQPVVQTGFGTLVPPADEPGDHPRPAGAVHEPAGPDPRRRPRAPRVLGRERARRVRGAARQGRVAGGDDRSRRSGRPDRRTAPTTTGTTARPATGPRCAGTPGSCAATAGPGPTSTSAAAPGTCCAGSRRTGRAAGFEVSAWSAAAARATAPGAAVYDDPDDLPDARPSAPWWPCTCSSTSTTTPWRPRSPRGGGCCVPGGRALVATPDPAGRGHALSGPRWVGYADPTHVNLKPHARWRDAAGRARLRGAARGQRRAVERALRRGCRRPGDAVRAAPAFAQYLAGRLVLPPGSGESAVFVVERSGND